MGMGKMIRHTLTLTITITETWTFMWEDLSPVTPVANSTVLVEPIAKEQPDEQRMNEGWAMLRLLTAPANAPALAGTHSDDLLADPAIGSKPRRTRRAAKA
jgi:hypothetical protein